MRGGILADFSCGVMMVESPIAIRRGGGEDKAVRYASGMDYSCRMKLFINGEERPFVGVATLAELIDHLGMKGDRVAGELNREIVPAGALNYPRLGDGGRLENLHFWGGGKRLRRHSG